MGKKKIVLDTNILISALGWSGKPRAVFNQVLDGKCDMIISLQQIEELRRVMDYDKFDFSKEQKSIFISIILELATVVVVSGKLKVIADDPDDDIILETGVENHAEYFITGDPHLIEIKEFNGVKIITAHQFLELVTQSL